MHVHGYIRRCTCLHANRLELFNVHGKVLQIQLTLCTKPGVISAHLEGEKLVPRAVRTVVNTLKQKKQMVKV